MSIPDSDHQHLGHITRRSIILGAGLTLMCAPAIVPITSLMRVRGLTLPIDRPQEGFVRRLMFYQLYRDLQAGRMTTIVNGSIVPAAEARRIVAYVPSHMDFLRQKLRDVVTMIVNEIAHHIL
ncbi:MAG: hypothetical protein IT536_19015 [Hyphomicrobiales bacterium]|nr:hypothetical protein [Hyphomicrobiales bacterium]